MRRNYDIEIVRGETYDNEIEFSVENGNVSLSGKSAKAQVRPEEESPDLLAEFECAVDVDQNTITIRLDSAQTVELQPGNYAYDVWLIGTGFRKCYLGGKFIVRGRTTIIEDETLTINGGKTWDDEDNADGIRPASITIRLLANGEEIEQRNITVDDNWAWTFTGLPIYSGGTRINYTLTEDPVDGYTTTVDGYYITNRHEVE